MDKVFRRCNFLCLLLIFSIAMVVSDIPFLFSQGSSPVTVRVRSALSESQLQELVFITFDKTVRILTLDPGSRESHVDFTLPGAGTYLCFIHSMTDINIDGKLRNVLGHGALQVKVSGGEVFELTADFSDFKTRGTFLVGLEPGDSIGKAAQTAPSSSLGSGEAGTPRSPYIPPFRLPAPAPEAARPLIPPAVGTPSTGTANNSQNSEDRLRQQRIRELEVQLSRMESELGSLQMFMDSYSQFNDVLLGSGTGSGTIDNFFMAPRTFSSGNSLPSPLEGYRQYLQVLKDELDRLRNGG